MAAERSSVNSFYLKLPDGRTVCGQREGDSNSQQTIIYCHGFPGSRIEAELGYPVGKKLGLSFLSLDRAGFGGSTHDPKRTINSWAIDSEAVISQLGITNVSIMGVSGGTPYALSLAARLGNRVKRVAIVSGMSSFTSTRDLEGMNGVNKSLLALGRWSEQCGVLACSAIASLWHYNWFVKLWFGALLPAVDRECFKDLRAASVLRRSYREALTQGTHGAVQDYKLLIKPWEIAFDKIQAPVDIWHGSADSYVPPKMAYDLAAMLPNAQVKLQEGQGHFMIIKILEPILETLI